MFWRADQIETVPARGQKSFGAPIGIMLLDCTAPYIPGSVGNASTFSAPVMYKTVEGLTVEAVLSREASDHAAAVVATAQELVKAGARMITANCGFTARFQRDVQEAVDVPVLLSSLMLVPFLQATLPLHQKVGVLTASTNSLDEAFLDSTDLVIDKDRLALKGIDGAPAFTSAFITCDGTADIPAIRAELVAAANEMIEEDPTVGSILLECSEFPPYAAAVQAATGRPVYDFTSLIEFHAGGNRRTSFDGYF
jgi:head-tail adaptor